ncbi:uncharacterized protein LOC111696105 isoform X2 [Eurytemora carolleeae]|uniref:uncharacterized protein LOC111696105 isoform X2 n=1 Tax=Eurytemora carolleeae TaxID=1294199 RepID=UPI000C77BD3D|nr:uncharacterized protein LOC111696105 isoform X2 [Eurytemora carolleeae]|eukprot:XP_023321414.1 uncharacterized protein LOC111696105 isoform X2 [Eurytemora affinis]
MTESIVSLLVSPSKLERDKGILLFEELIKSEDEKVVLVEQMLDDLVLKTECTWEEKHGFLLGKKSLVGLKKIRKDDQFVEHCQVSAVKYLQDEEVRVRGAAENDGAVKEKEEVGKLFDKLAGITPRDAAQVFHDTAGWKNLETSMKCLQHMVEGCGKGFESEFSAELFNLLITCLDHTNRFVRETGYYVCATLVSACSGQNTEDNPLITQDAMNVDEIAAEALDEDLYSPILIFGNKLSIHLAKGLSDNWSQVRLASTTATRVFLLSLTPEQRKQFYPILLPRLCLNRYYLAEGVRLYSQRTWSEVVGAEGCTLVKDFLKEVVEYYIEATQADNHAVREAACQCIAELAKKINLEALQPYVQHLLRTLIECFKDDSWPVRDMACVAAGSFVCCYPEESKTGLDILLPLFWSNIADPISSVRQGAAIALANTIRAYGSEILPDIITKLETGLENLTSQPVESEKYGDLDTSPANFSVAKRIRDNDVELHEDQQMYSCGSLAPKMGRGGGGGCTDSKFRKVSEPWELADGCVHLVGEIATIKECEEELDKLLSAVARVQEHKHYVNHLHLFQTVCVRFAGIAKAVNKKILKPHLEEFFDIIFYSLESENGLAEYAAEDCLNTLSTVLGPNILRGRIENYNPSYLSKLDNIREPMDGPGRPFGSRKPCGVLSTSPSRPFSDGDMMVGMESGGGGASSPRSIPGSGRSYQAPLGGTPT